MDDNPLNRGLIAEYVLQSELDPQGIHQRSVYLGGQKGLDLIAICRIRLLMHDVRCYGPWVNLCRPWTGVEYA